MFDQDEGENWRVRSHQIGYDESNDDDDDDDDDDVD